MGRGRGAPAPQGAAVTAVPQPRGPVAEREPGEDDGDDAPSIDLAELRREEAEGELASRVLAERTAAPRATTARQAPARTRIAMSTIEPRPVDWLWMDRIPRGSIVSIDGLPASGKSSLATEIVACVTTGRALYGAASTAPRSAIWIGHEEGLATALRPRLDAAGADPGRVFVYQTPPSFPADYEWLANEIRQTGAAIVVIDPIDAYLDFGDRGDSHRNGDVRARLVGLGAVAEETGATIVMIRHWRKSGGTHALYRAAGSIAYSALARATVSVAAVDPNDPTRRLAAWAKMSDAPEPTSIAFRLGDRRRVEWIGDDPRSAMAVMAAADAAVTGRGGASEAATATDGAEAWLMRQFEAAEAISVVEIKSRALIEGLAWRTIEKAKSRLRIRSSRVGGAGANGHWVWVAPSLRVPHPGALPADTAEPKTAEQTSIAVLGESAPRAAPNSVSDGDLATPANTASANIAEAHPAALADPPNGGQA